MEALAIHKEGGSQRMEWLLSGRAGNTMPGGGNLEALGWGWALR